MINNFNELLSIKSLKAFNFIFSDNFKPYLKMNNFNSNSDLLKSNNDLITELKQKDNNKKLKDISLSLKPLNDNNDNGLSYEFIENKRQNVLYPNIALNEININGYLYTLNKSLIYENNINTYDNIEYKQIIKRLNNNVINENYNKMLNIEFNINTNNLFIKGLNKENKDKNFKDFCFNFMNYCLKTNLNNITKKDIKDLFFNVNKSKTTINKKVKKILNFLKDIGFLTDIKISKKVYRYRIVKSLTYDGLNINQKELNKIILNRLNKTLKFNQKDLNIIDKKDLFDLLNKNKLFKAKLKFKPYGYTLFKNGYLKRYYLYKNHKKVYIGYCNTFKEIKPTDLKIKVINKIFNILLTKKEYLNKDYFIVKKINFGTDKKVKIYKKDFNKLYKKLNINYEIKSFKNVVYQNVKTLNNFSHKLVLNNNIKINGYGINNLFDLNKFNTIDKKPIKKLNRVNNISYNDLLKLLNQ